MSDYELYHYGIKGMKWGVRRTAAQLGHVVKKGAKKAKEAIDAKRSEKKAQKLRKKPLRELTDAELKDRIQRLQLEKNAADLMRSTAGVDAERVSAGKKFLSNLGSQVLMPSLVNAGKNALTKYLDKSMMKALGLEKDDPLKALKDEVAKTDLLKRKRENEKFLEKDGNDDPIENLKKINEQGKAFRDYTILNDYFKKRYGDTAQNSSNGKSSKDDSSTVYTDFADEPVSNTKNTTAYRRGNEFLALLEEPKK